MKIGIIARKNLDDTSLWSGTVYHLSKYIAEEYEIVPVIVPVSVTEKVIRKGTGFVSAKKNLKSTLALPDIKRRLTQSIQQAQKEGCNVYFAPAGSELIASGGIPDDCKVIYLSDATYHLMTNYYWFDSEHDQRIGNLFEEKALQRADAVIYSSEWAKQDAVDYYGVEEGKISILPFPSYMDDIPFTASDIRDENKELIKLLLVGVDWERKGVDLAIDCLKKLNAAASAWKYELDIAGLDRPENFIENNVRFHGKLSKANDVEKQKLISLYQEADIFLLPTKAEASAIVYSEASMFGLPVFTHKTGGAATYVKDNYNGRLLELGVDGSAFADAILQMLRQDKLSEYSRNARALYEKELNYHAWMDAFQGIVGKLI